MNLLGIELILILLLSLGIVPPIANSHITDSNTKGELDFVRLEYSENECDFLGFKYIEITAHAASDDIMHAAYFMDPDSFTEKNLIKLMTFASKKYPEPNLLVIRVLTDWDQMEEPWPKHCPPFGISSPPNEVPDLHKLAIYRRAKRENSEYIRFKMDGADAPFVRVNIKTTK